MSIRIRNYFFAAVITTLGATATAQEKPQAGSRHEVQVLTAAIRSEMIETDRLIDATVFVRINTAKRQAEAFARLQKAIADPKIHAAEISLALQNFEDNELAASEANGVISNPLQRIISDFSEERERAFRTGKDPKTADHREFAVWSQRVSAIVGPSYRPEAMELEAKATAAIKALNEREKATR